jgi:signal transduction histidine kinase
VLTPETVLSGRLRFGQGKGGVKGCEGIGLSIVKRLYEFLDASSEIVTSAEIGTTFRVEFPVDDSTAIELVIRAKSGG